MTINRLIGMSIYEMVLFTLTLFTVYSIQVTGASLILIAIMTVAVSGGIIPFTYPLIYGVDLDVPLLEQIDATDIWLLSTVRRTLLHRSCSVPQDR